MAAPVFLRCAAAARLRKTRAESSVLCKHPAAGHAPTPGCAVFAAIRKTRFNKFYHIDILLSSIFAIFPDENIGFSGTLFLQFGTTRGFRPELRRKSARKSIGAFRAAQNGLKTLCSRNARQHFDAEKRCGKRRAGQPRGAGGSVYSGSSNQNVLPCPTMLVTP